MTFMQLPVAMPWSTPAVTDPTAVQEQGLESNGAQDRVCRAGEGAAAGPEQASMAAGNRTTHTAPTDRWLLTREEAAFAQLSSAGRWTKE